MNTNNIQLDIIDVAENKFSERYDTAVTNITALHNNLYADHPNAKKSYNELLNIIKKAFKKRSENLKTKDLLKNADKMFQNP